MYLRSLKLHNIRAIETFAMDFDEAELPGWHVLLGANGAGKSSVIRSLALVLAGPKEAAAASGLLDEVVNFINASGLLPHGAMILEVTSSEVRAVDGGGSVLAVEQLSDGYRSVLSMIFEILRQMARAYGPETFMKGLRSAPGTVDLPGVIAIDEVDAHLHPSWQNDIGPWFTRCFPRVQFIVTTHSPIVCRAARSIWRLPAPGSSEAAERISGADFERLTKGTILDAYGTELFGRDVSTPEVTKKIRSEVARLNRLALRAALSASDQGRLEQLQRTLPTSAASLD